MNSLDGMWTKLSNTTTHLLVSTEVISQCSDSNIITFVEKSFTGVVKLAVACKVPSTRLKISDTGEFLAIGASDGAVTVIRADKLTKV